MNHVQSVGTAMARLRMLCHCVIFIFDADGVRLMEHSHSTHCNIDSMERGPVGKLPRLVRASCIRVPEVFRFLDILIGITTPTEHPRGFLFLQPGYSCWRRKVRTTLSRIGWCASVEHLGGSINRRAIEGSPKFSLLCCLFDVLVCCAE